MLFYYYYWDNPQSEHAANSVVSLLQNSPWCETGATWIYELNTVAILLKKKKPAPRNTEVIQHRNALRCLWRVY